MRFGWTGCFILTAVVYLLQLVPIIGIFLMFVAAPFWPIVTVNLGFILMAIDALGDPGRRWLLAGPLLWFGGYGVATVASHLEAQRFDAEIVAFNAGKHVAFDPATMDLVIEPDRLDESHASDLNIWRLIATHTIHRGFEAVDLGGERGIVTRRTAIVGTRCPGQMGVGFEENWRRPIANGFGTGKPLIFAQQLCIWTQAATPVQPVVRVQPQPQRGNRRAIRVTQDIVIASPDGQRLTLRSGRTQPLTWLPMPIFGCGLNSSAPSWDCSHRFLRETPHTKNGTVAPNGPAAVVAAALHLRPASIHERYPDAEWK